MIRKLSRSERCIGDLCEAKDEEQQEAAIDALDMEALVDLAVTALSNYGIEEIDYDDDELPNENQAICQDADGNEVGVEIQTGKKGAKLVIDLDEDEDIEIDLSQSVDDVTQELSGDLEDKYNEQEEAEESCRRYEAWKRNMELREEGRRVSMRRR